MSFKNMFPVSPEPVSRLSIVQRRRGLYVRGLSTLERPASGEPQRASRDTRTPLERRSRGRSLWRGGKGLLRDGPLETPLGRPKPPLSLPLERPKRLLRAHPLERLNRHLERQKRCREARGQSRAERRSLGSAHRRSRAADDRRRAHRTHRGTAHIWGSSSRPTRHVSSGDKRAGHTGCW